MSWQRTVKPVAPKLVYGRSGGCGATERALIPGDLPSCPQGLPVQQWAGKGRQKSAEAIVPAESGEGPNSERQGIAETFAAR